MRDFIRYEQSSCFHNQGYAEPEETQNPKLKTRARATPNSELQTPNSLSMPPLQFEDVSLGIVDVDQS